MLPSTHVVLDPLQPMAWARARAAAVAAEAEAWLIPYWTWAWAGLWLFLLRTANRPPAVAVVHNPSDHDGRSLHRVAARLVLGRCGGLFTHAANLADSLRRSYPDPPVASHPLPPPAVEPLGDRTTARESLGLPPNGRVALFFGFIRPYKGVDLLLEALAHPDVRDSWHAVVAGEAWGGDGDRLRALHDRLGLHGRVSLRLGYVPETELEVYLAAADVIVLPYRSGSQSAVAPRALAHGLPVLSTDVGGLSEVVRNGVNGLLVAPCSSEALTEALVRLQEGPLLQACAAGARASARSLSWDGYATRLEGLVRRVIDA